MMGHGFVCMQLHVMQVGGSTPLSDAVKLVCSSVYAVPGAFVPVCRLLAKLQLHCLGELVDSILYSPLVPLRTSKVHLYAAGFVSRQGW